MRVQVRAFSCASLAPRYILARSMRKFSGLGSQFWPDNPVHHANTRITATPANPGFFTNRQGRVGLGMRRPLGSMQPGIFNSDCVIWRILPRCVGNSRAQKNEEFVPGGRSKPSSRAEQDWHQDETTTERLTRRSRPLVEVIDCEAWSQPSHRAMSIASKSSRHNCRSQQLTSVHRVVWSCDVARSSDASVGQRCNRHNRHYSLECCQENFFWELL